MFEQLILGCQSTRKGKVGLHLAFGWTCAGQGRVIGVCCPEAEREHAYREAGSDVSVMEGVAPSGQAAGRGVYSCISLSPLGLPFPPFLSSFPSRVHKLGSLAAALPPHSLCLQHVAPLCAMSRAALLSIRYFLFGAYAF